MVGRSRRCSDLPIVLSRLYANSVFNLRAPEEPAGGAFPAGVHTISKTMTGWMDIRWVSHIIRTILLSSASIHHQTVKPHQRDGASNRPRASKRGKLTYTQMTSEETDGWGHTWMKLRRRYQATHTCVSHMSCPAYSCQHKTPGPNTNTMINGSSHMLAYIAATAHQHHIGGRTSSGGASTAV